MFSRYVSVSEHRTMYLLEMWDGIKVKCTNKSKAEVCPVTVCEGSEFFSRFFFTSALVGGWVVSATLRSLYTGEREPVRIVQKAVWTPGQVCTGMENLVSPGGSNPGLPCPYRVSVETELSRP